MKNYLRTTNKINIDHVDEYWFNNNPALTHFMSTLSTLFLEGESFFMKSITNYLKTVSPEQKEDIKVFCRQENNHSSFHQELNKSFKNKVLLNLLEKRTGKVIKTFTGFLTPRQKLGATAALEHVTCCLAEEFLKRKDLQELMTSSAKDAWMLHAVEETSYPHREIAYNIYKTLSENNLERYFLMVLASVILAFVVLWYWLEIMKNDTFKGFPEALSLLFFKNGFIVNIIPQYLQWFSNSYTP